MRFWRAREDLYAEGYRNGEDSVAVDWYAALSDVLPDDVPADPDAVAAYIARLHQETGDGARSATL